MKERAPVQPKYFLAKTDPETYSIEQFEREGQTVWDGVRNPQALRAIRDMKAGDRVFIYHSMSDAAIVWVLQILSETGALTRKIPSLRSRISAFRCRIEPPVTLREIKQSGLFDDWALVRQSRLSTMAVPDKFVQWIRSHRPGLPVLNSGSQHSSETAGFQKWNRGRWASVFQPVCFQWKESCLRQYGGNITALVVDYTGVFRGPCRRPGF